MYTWYESVAEHLVLFARDAERAASDGTESEWLTAVRDGLLAGMPRRKTVRAAIGHALEFETWRSLTRRQG